MELSDTASSLLSRVNPNFRHLVPTGFSAKRSSLVAGKLENRQSEMRARKRWNETARDKEDWEYASSLATDFRTTRETVAFPERIKSEHGRRGFGQTKPRRDSLGQINHRRVNDRAIYTNENVNGRVGESQWKVSARIASFFTA